MPNDRREVYDDLGTALRVALFGLQSTIWTALPCAVISFDAVKMSCSAQPMIKARVALPDQSHMWVKLPVLVDVPVMFPNAGGFSLTFPVQPGDEVLVIFSSRCIDSWWQLGAGSKGEGQVQAELRMHDLSDGFAIPGPRSQPRVLGAISTTDVQLRNDAGTSYLSIKANGDIVLTTPGQATVNAAAATVNAPSTINGDLQVNGNGTFTGKLTATDLAVPTLPSYSGHTHFSRTDGTAKTSVPNAGT